MEETTPLLGDNSTQSRISVKKTIVSAICALVASIIFAGNNLLIQEKNLKCSDLLLFRSILQLVTFTILIKLTEKQWFPAIEVNSRRDFVVEIIYLVAQVLFEIVDDQ